MSVFSPDAPPASGPGGGRDGGPSGGPGVEPAGGPSAGPGGGPAGEPPSGGRRLPRGTTYLVIAAVAVLSVLGYAVFASRGVDYRGTADPENARPDGARAVAQVLGDRGVDVVVVRSQAVLLDLADSMDADTTVLVANPELLTASTAARLKEVTRSAAELVLLEPTRWLVNALDLPVEASRSSGSLLTAECSTELADPGDGLTGASWAYPPDPGASAQECFPSEDGPHLVQLRQLTGPEVTLLGSVEPVLNETTLDADNAALALRLLGREDRLVWYVPDLADGVPSDASDRETVIPPAVGPAMLVLAGAVVGLMLWRGRRLGRIVPEPLPVVVRAVETTESRGRLYRRAKDRNRALVVLQQATRTRLVAALGLPPAEDVTPVATATATVTGRRVDEVLWLLRDARVDDDEALVRTATELARLEQAVRNRAAGLGS